MNACDFCATITTLREHGLFLLCEPCAAVPMTLCEEFAHDYSGTRAGVWGCRRCGAALNHEAVDYVAPEPPAPAYEDYWC